MARDRTATVYVKVIFENIGAGEVSKRESPGTSIFAQMGRYYSVGKFASAKFVRTTCTQIRSYLHINLPAARSREKARDRFAKKLQRCFISNSLRNVLNRYTKIIYQ
jgi:hypothetical protein